MENLASLLLVAMSCAVVLCGGTVIGGTAIELDDDFSMEQAAAQLGLDRCKSQPCKNGARCAITMNFRNTPWYKCTCLDGYTGIDCSIGPCDSNPCTNGGQCSNHGNSYYCACPAGADCSSELKQFITGGYSYKATGKFADSERSAAEICANTFGSGAVVPEAYSKDTLGRISELRADKGKAVWLAGYVQNGKAYWTSGNPFPEHLPWVGWAENFIGGPDNSGTISSEKKCLGAMENELFTMNCGWYNVVCAVPKSPYKHMTYRL